MCVVCTVRYVLCNGGGGGGGYIPWWIVNNIYTGAFMLEANYGCLNKNIYIDH